jgi:acetyl esterase/lipase
MTLNYLLQKQVADPSSQIVRARLLRKKRSTPLFDPGIPVSAQRLALDNAGHNFQPLPGQHIKQVKAGGVSAEWITVHTHASSRQVVLYLHGGAFITGSCLSSRPLATKLAESSGLPVLSINYRLAPEYAFPAQIEDATAAYHWLLASGIQAQDIVMAGDSAGGNLVLASLLTLRDAGDPLPTAVALLSPWVDLAATGSSFRTLADADPYLVPHCLEEAARRYLGKVDARTPLASPLYGDLRGLPPALIQVGSDEILLDDAVRLAQRLHASGGRADLEIWQGMWHVWHYFAAQIPEGQLACDRIGYFLHSMFGQGDLARQEGETTAGEHPWIWQHECCNSIERAVSEQRLMEERRARKLIA